MSIMDLRQLNSRQIAPLLSEEAQFWKDELRWDFRTSLELIKKFVDAKSLSGCVAIEEGQPAGYAFYVIEENKGLLGGLYVSPRYPQMDLARQLLACVIETLQAIPRVERIEAQLVPFGDKFDQALAQQNFRLYPRQFMLLDLERPAGSRLRGQAGLAGGTRGAASGLTVEPWDNRHFAPCARLIELAYANHMDGEINDQYRSESGALKFLKNVIVLPGCGQFQPHASFILREPHSNELAGAVLTSAVAPGVAHTTQICIVPGYQRNGLGRQLMEASIRALRARHFEALTLTVTSANRLAVNLYESMGFQIIKTFTAGVWQPSGYC